MPDGGPRRGQPGEHRHLHFHPGGLAGWIDGAPLRPQPGGFYGGWIAPELVGPFKGAPGSEGW